MKLPVYHGIAPIFAVLFIFLLKLHRRSGSVDPGFGVPLSGSQG